MQSRTLIMDGAYGTNLPKGNSLEVYNIEKPELVEALHSEYAKYADILKTNTFNVGPAWNSFYDWRAVIKKAYQLVSGKGRKIAASIGPQTYSFIAGDSFSTVRRNYRLIALEHLKHNPDYILLETQIEARIVRAAVLGIKDALKSQDVNIPIIVNVCVTQQKLMQDGTVIDSVMSMLTVMGVQFIGINCSSGAELDYELASQLAIRYTNFVWCPNNGMPNADGQYNMKPEVWANYLNKVPAAILGGCCGTTPEHIKLLRRVIRLKSKLQFSAPPLFDEKFNIFGSKRFKFLVENEDWTAITRIALDLPNEVGMDVNLDDGLGSQVRRWSELKKYLPLISQRHSVMIDTAEWDNFFYEIAEQCAGVVFFNSIKDGPAVSEEVQALNEYGIIPVVRASDDSQEAALLLASKRIVGACLKDSSMKVLGVSCQVQDQKNCFDRGSTICGISNGTFAIKGDSGLRKAATIQLYNELKPYTVIGPLYLWDIMKADRWLKDPQSSSVVETSLSDEEYELVSGWSEEKEKQMLLNPELTVREFTETLYKLGDSFAEGRANLIQLAKAGETANNFISKLPKQETSKGEVIIATVKGDLHDIGKNITKMLLQSAGYQVKDLGVDVGVGDIIKSITESTVAIALSGLLAGALRVMQGSVEVIRKHSSLPIFLGGAVVSESFVQEHIKEKDVFYTTDGLSLAALLDSRSIKHE